MGVNIAAFYHWSIIAKGLWIIPKGLLEKLKIAAAILLMLQCSFSEQFC
jgi:hypothetical protein